MNAAKSIAPYIFVFIICSSQNATQLYSFKIIGISAARLRKK
jgi:hypothetical protein